MRRMIYRHGLIFVAAMGLGLMVTSARVEAGSLYPPAGPASTASAMWTLNDIYNVMDTRTTNVTLRTGGFTEPTAGPTNGTMRSLNDIMTLVTNRAPAQKTGQTPTVPFAAPVGSDGNLQIGVAWPNPRFTVLGDTNAPVDVLTNCVRDNLTGLIWARNANLFGSINWVAAVASCTNLNYGGQTDWRLPNVCELNSLIAWQYSSPAVCNTAGTAKWSADNPFTGIQNSAYWTSSKFMGDVGEWYVVMLYGTMNYNVTNSPYFVWPVRGGR